MLVISKYTIHFSFLLKRFIEIFNLIKKLLIIKLMIITY